MQTIDYSLYAILDKQVAAGKSLTVLAEQAISGGAGIVQLRDKTSKSDEFYTDALRVKAVAHEHHVPLIINDRIDIALAVEADGVHLGQEDFPFEAARELIGNKMILGVSVHNMEEFAVTMNCRPDYFGVGTIYPSPSKIKLKSRGPEIIRQLRAKTTLPLIAIGGITLDNLDSVIEAGADGVAVISGLFATENVYERARQFVEKIRHVKDSMVMA